MARAKFKNVIKSILLLGIIGCAGWLGYLYYDTNVLSHKRYAVSREQFSNGTMPKLPGPYLSEGNPSDLKFEVIDLGIGTLVEMSEDGDVLYNCYGNAPVEEKFRDVDGFERTGLTLKDPIVRLRKRDGTFATFPEAFDVRLTPGGKVYEARGDDHKFKIWQDGKIVFDGSANAKVRPNQPTITNWSGTIKVADIGIFPSESSNSNIIFEPEGNYSVDNRKDKPYVVITAASTQLGVLGIPWRTDLVSKFKNSRQLSLTTKSGETLVDLPSELAHPVIRAGKSVAVLYNSLFSPAHVYRFQDGKFTILPVVEGVVNVNVSSVNSHDEYIIETMRTIASPKGSAYPYVNQSYFVTGSKQYEISKLMSHLGIKDELSGRRLGYPASRNLDENGNLVVQACFDDFQHVLLLRRLK